MEEEGGMNSGEGAGEEEEEEERHQYGDDYAC